ncbi:dephospho-CoA kinase [Tannockella kyphosi]|uniref:dephospho-CoA kinase n=1 Tax=Tannockella kyphosi TaxID=2899121 RepID=UPI00201137B8|nr:dephospho-CoA kinase [Tannockella kyphosi]
MIVYGITGSIACGKSTVTKYLLEKGYIVVDSDKLSHQALFDETCKKQIYELFPEVFINNNIDRKKLGAILFSNKIAKKQIESIIHPYVIEKLNAAKKLDQNILFLDIPLLYEAKLEGLVDKVIVVYVTKDIQIERLIKRDNCTKEQALQRINNQIDIEEKRKKANFVLDNSLLQEDLYKQIDMLIGENIENKNK